MSIRRGEPPSLSNRSRPIRPRSPSEMLEPERAPERPKGSRLRRESAGVGRVLGGVSSIMTTLVLAMGLIGGGAFMVNHQFTAEGPLQQERQITIPRGEGRIEIATRLEREGFISSRWAFLLNHLFRSMLSKDPLELKAGEYKFAPGASMKKVLETIAKGRAVLYKLSLPEGLTSQQFVQRINGSQDMNGEITEIPPEGSLMPDTYNFSKGMARSDLIKRIQEKQQAFLNEAWQNRAENLPIANEQEALILASIVEKETGKAEERGLVASVFINRLRKNMRLQSDPTIIYGLVGGQGSLGRSITRQDKASKTLYNTYHINGLPPTPICNPGREAITAVLNPPETQDLYFVADGTGGHIFSTNLKDHNVAVAKWRKIEKAAKQKEAATKVVAKTIDGADPKNVDQNPQDGGLALINASGADGSSVVPIPPLETNPAALAVVSGDAPSIPLPVRKPRQ